MLLAQNSWIQKTDLPSIGRYGATGFSIGDYGYVLGGNKTGNIYTNELWQYNSLTDTWVQKASYPLNIYSASVFVIDNEAYVGNGNLFGGPPTNNFYKYSPVSDTWTPIASFPGSARYGSASFAIGDKGYVCAGGYLNDMWEYNSTTNTWSQKASLPGVARKGTTGFAVNGKGYIVAGKSNNAVYLNDTWEYNPVTNSWTQKGNLSTIGRSVASTFVLNNIAYCSTGHSALGSSLDDLWEYNSVSGNWTYVNQIDGGDTTVIRHDAVSFVCSNKAYVSTGISTNGVRRNDLWAFEPSYVYSTDSVSISACNEFIAPSMSDVWDSTGIYIDTLVNADINGNDSIITVNLTIQFLDNGISQISNNVLTADQNGITYQWVDCDGMNVIQGETNQMFTPSYSGDFAVIVSSGECIDTSDCIPMKSISLHESVANNIRVYPNPFTDVLKFISDVKIQDIKVFDVFGKAKQFEFSSDELRFKGEPGVYYVYFIDNSEKINVFKILKK